MRRPRGAPSAARTATSFWRVDALASQKEQTDRYNVVLTQQRKGLTEQVRQLEGQNDEKDRQIQILHQESQTNMAEIASLREDNERIRSQIYAMDRAVAPIRGEEYYLLMFQDLRGDFENWVVRNAKAEKQQKLSEADAASLLAIISKSRAEGTVTSKFLRSNQMLREWYSNVRSRMVLIRHIVSMFIFDHVFEPIVFGLSPDAARALVWMENDILSQGLIPTQTKLTCKATRSAIY